MFVVIVVVVVLVVEEWLQQIIPFLNRSGTRVIAVLGAGCRFVTLVPTGVRRRSKSGTLESRLVSG